MWAACVLMACTLAGQAGAPADDALKLEVSRLVRQLQSPQLAEREAAEQALVALGPQALDLLPPPGPRTPVEVEQRLARVRHTLQVALADQAARPSTITLKADAMPLSKVLAALKQQSGNEIVDYRERFGHAQTDPPITLSFDRTPFWQALDQVLDQAGLTVYPFGEERAVCVVARPPGQVDRSSHAAYSGPFRLEPVSVIAQRDLRDPDGRSLVVAVEVSWEPRLKPIGLSVKMSDMRATDENGNPLPLDDRQADLEMPVGDQSIATRLLVPLKLPPRTVQKIASIAGKLDVMLPGKVEEFRFDDLLGAKGVEKRVAGATVTLDQVRRNNDLWQVIMSVKFDEAGEALQSHRGWIFRNEAYLEDPDGKRIPYDVYETISQSEREVGLAYGFVLDQPPEKLKFVYKTPGTIMSKSFDYELKAIDLP